MNHGNTVFSQENLNKKQRMGGCIIVMELSSWCCPHVQSFTSHIITKATKYLMVLPLCNGCASWCKLVMYRPTGVPKNCQHDLEIAAYVLCTLAWEMIDISIVRSVSLLLGHTCKPTTRHQ